MSSTQFSVVVPPAQSTAPASTEYVGGALVAYDNEGIALWAVCGVDQSGATAHVRQWESLRGSAVVEKMRRSARRAA